MAEVSRLHRMERQKRLLARFARAKGGATAVEFALVAAPFLLLVFGIVELALVSLVAVTLESAVSNTGRQIRTGQVQTTGGTAATFKAATCDKMSWIGSACNGALTIDVRTFTGFSASSTATKPTTPCWDPGGPGSIVLVRAYYSWPLITPLLSGLQTSGGKRLITAVSTFSNEPYSDTPAAAVTCPT